jgi:hypothetical protein
MAKKQTSKAASQGRRGALGNRGANGRRGLTGRRGPAGPPGPAINKSDVLAMVEDQFNDIRRELRLQLERMAQIQLQLDQIHKVVQQLLLLDQQKT